MRRQALTKKQGDVLKGRCSEEYYHFSEDSWIFSHSQRAVWVDWRTVNINYCNAYESSQRAGIYYMDQLYAKNHSDIERSVRKS